MILKRRNYYMALVSIITPTYKCINTIEETYKSVLVQTFSGWEWMVVDKVYHKAQGLNWLKSWFYVVRWALYGKKKYKNVK